MATKKKSSSADKKATPKKTAAKGNVKSAKKSAKKQAEPAKKEAKKGTAGKKTTAVKKTAAKNTIDKKKPTAPTTKVQKATIKKANVKKSTTLEKKAAPKTKTSASSHNTASAKTKPEAKSTKSKEKQAPATTQKVVASKSKSLGSSNGKGSAKTATGKPKFVYKPEPSILDSPKEQPRKRYSDGELQEFKVLIQGKLEAARKELTYLQGLITRKDEAGTDDTENKYMGVEDGSGTMEREQLSQLASRQIQFIDKLEKALQRIENKTYGICRETGKLIDKARLRAVPHATLSIEAKLSKKS